MVMRCGLAVGGLALAAGCTSDPAEPAWSGPSGKGPSGSASSAGAPAPEFREPVSYAYVLARGCGTPLGRYRTTVRNGAVVTAERLDAVVPASPGNPAVDPGPATGQDGEEIEVPALGELLEMARTAAEDGAEVNTTLDAADGHPVKVEITVPEEDAECFTVSDYAPAL
jgi:hypothetical protein